MNRVCSTCGGDKRMLCTRCKEKDKPLPKFVGMKGGW